MRNKQAHHQVHPVVFGTDWSRSNPLACFIHKVSDSRIARLVKTCMDERPDLARGAS